MPVRSHTPSPPPTGRVLATTTHDNLDDPTEVTTLLPSSTSRSTTPRILNGKTQTHVRKASIATSTTGERRLGPAEQVARVSKKGQRVSLALQIPVLFSPSLPSYRISFCNLLMCACWSLKRILTTPLLLFIFFLLTLLTFISIVLTILLALNTAYDLTAAIKWAPYRGSGFLEVWIAGLGAWCGIGALMFVSNSFSNPRWYGGQNKI
jgi:hypothetical protein